MLRAILAASLLSTVALAAQTVDGHVVNSATGAAIPNVRVALVQGSEPAYSAVTDADGRFHIAAVKDGTYQTSYHARGFFRSPSVLDPPSQSRLQVIAGSDPVHLEAKLQPVPKISGRVLDADGNPVPGATLFILQHRYGCNEHSCLSTLQRIQSGDKGEFTSTNLEALPGTWMLSATAKPAWDPPPPVDRQRFGWATTLYPGVTDPQIAENIPAQPGADVWSLEIKLAAVPVHRLRGRILDAHGDPAPNAMLTLSNGLGPGFYGMTRDDGTFEFPSVPDGEWRLSGRTTRNGTKIWAARWIQMKRADLEDIDLRLAAPFTLHARIVTEFPDSLDVILSYENNDQMEDTPRVTGHQAGEHEIVFPEVYPGSYRVSILNSPAGRYYLDSIHLGDLDALASDVSVQSAGQPLTITYKLGGGTVRGTVENCDSCAVVLLPVDPALRRGEIVRDATCAANGQFEIDAVRPGEYYTLAVAFDGTTRWFDAMNEDMLNHRATRIIVRASQSTNAELRLISLQ